MYTCVCMQICVSECVCGCVMNERFCYRLLLGADYSNQLKRSRDSQTGNGLLMVERKTVQSESVEQCPIIALFTAVTSLKASHFQRTTLLGNNGFKLFVERTGFLPRIAWFVETISSHRISSLGQLQQVFTSFPFVLTEHRRSYGLYFLIVIFLLCCFKDMIM